MDWRRLFSLPKARPTVRLHAEALEDRAVPAVMTAYEAAELQVMNQFRANPQAFANDLNALYHGGAYQSPNGYAASDPIWADLRAEINAAETGSWRSGFNGASASSFMAHVAGMPARAPLAWDSAMQDGALNHSSWMLHNNYSHSGFSQTSSYSTFETTNPILGLPRAFPQYADYFNTTGLLAAGENISFGANQFSNAFSALQAGTITLDGFYQRMAYADVIGFLLEYNNGGPSPWGHLDNIGGNFNVVGISEVLYENTYYEGGANGVSQSSFGTHRFGLRSGVNTATVTAYLDANNNNAFDAGEGLAAQVGVTFAGGSGSVGLANTGWGSYTFSNSGSNTFTAVYNGATLGTQTVTGNQNRSVVFRITDLPDTTPPVSSVSRLPAFDTANVFTVRWSGTDVGRGIATYDVYASVDSGPFTLWQNDTAATSAVYTGSLGHRYSFFSVATDNAANVEATPAGAQATVLLQSFNAPPPPNLGQIAQDLAHSDEAYIYFITQAYQTYLHRAPDSAGLANWLAAMRNLTVSDEQLEAFFIGSPEYIATKGGLGPTWITSMYQDLLGRTPSTGEVNGWVAQLNSGASPVSIAFGFAASAEREGQRVVANYQNLLGRTPSQAEIDGWVDRFVNHGMTNETMLGGFAGSSEFFNTRGQSSPQVWVSQAFLALLHRPASASDVATYNSVLVPPTNIGQLAQALSHSAESYTRFITNAYNVYLGRGPDPAGLSGWLSAMQNGSVTDEGLEAQFIGSAEYIANHGGAGAGWVTGLYQDLLGRTPSPSEVNTWVGQLNSGVSPYTVAFGFAASAEREGGKVAGFIQRILGRAPGPNEVNAWVAEFQRGMSNETIQARFVGSTEDYIGAKANNNAVRWIDFAYFDLLGRAATQAEINALLPTL